jgi:hypothetical protein
MSSRLLQINFLVVGISFLLCDSARAAVDFSRDIQPILSENCYHCHGPDAGRRKAKFRLDTQEGAFGPVSKAQDHKAIVPGHPDEGTLLERIFSTDADEVMPPPDSDRSLTEAQKQLLKQWIVQGAPWGKHWALIPPQRPKLPRVKQIDWPINAIDPFILSRLEDEHLSPSPDAPKETLLRRVTLDLTGLPPTPAEVEAFAADESPAAYERVVDRLLSSPRYGERMVWEWLDAARYADTNGYQGDNTRTMWPWRDWAIKALNDNMPYDQFTIEQLAGDLLPNSTNDQKVATGFCRNHMINGEGGRIAEENRVDYVMDQAETVSTVWLGMTVGCARCHDHKFDAITQKDYYSLFAFFNQTPVNGGGGSGQTEPVVDFATTQQKDKLKSLDGEVKRASAEVTRLEKELFPIPEGKTIAESPRLASLSGNIVATLKAVPEKRYLPSFKEIIPKLKATEPVYVAAVEKFLKAMDDRGQFNSGIPRVMVMADMPKPRETFVLVKGAYDKHADTVTANTLAALPPLPAEVPKNRLALAKWLVSPGHPLTARVTVNRMWQQFFGTGLVKTVDDFGVQGEKPVNTGLLDWLATEFVASDWNVKAMHRLIVTSHAYRQSSKTSADLYERDPENRLLARGPRFRLPAFMLRDQALFASGLMTEKLGGPPVKPYQPSGIWEEATFGFIKYQQDHGDALYRRSVYTFWRRIVGPTEFFDTAARQACTVKQSRTNTPLHALTTLNDTTFVEAARVMAQRVMKEGGTSPSDRIRFAWKLVMARAPSDREISLLHKSLDRLLEEYHRDPTAAAKLLAVGESKRDESLNAVDHAAYAGVCLAILNTDEAMTKE